MKIKCYILLWGSLFCLITSNLSAQQTSIFDLPITGSYQEKPLPEILNDLETRYPVKFYYIPERVPFYPITFEFTGQTFYQVMQKLLDGSLLTFSKWSANEIVLVPTGSLNRAFVENMISKWKTGEWKPPVLANIVEKSFVFGDPNTAPTSGKLTLKGKIEDDESNEAIQGATILVRETGQGQVSDEKGEFDFKLPPGKYTLQINYVSFQSQLNYVAMYSDGNLAVDLISIPQQLNEVLIRAQSLEKGAQSANMGVERLSARSIRELPSLMGEADVIKSLQTLPGVTNAGEGVAGFNVRGGNIDQNLILQDDAPLFNSSHALGFFSIFNADAVDQVNLYKGHIPAQYGGRLSSVLDVQLKDGNMRNWSGKGSVGIIASKFLAEGPIKKDKLSILVGVRQSYLGLALGQSYNPTIFNSKAGFNDGVMKLTWRVNSKNTLRLTGFTSHDVFRYGLNFGYNWQNYQVTGLWSKIHSDRFSTKIHTSYGAYRSEQNAPQGNNAFVLNNGLNTLKFKVNNLLSIGSQQAIHFGIEANLYFAQPESIKPLGNISVVLPEKVRKDNGREFSLYFQDEIKFSDRISLSVGSRLSYYQNVGPRTVWYYQPGQARENFTVRDSAYFSAGQVIKTYGGLEPRVSIKIGTGARSSFKASYNRLRQYIHLTSNTVAPTPVDVWQASNLYIPPQIADQFSAGWFLDGKDKKWETSIEAYYKPIKNLLDYKNLPQLLLNPRLETEILAGVGKAYGVEFSIHKTQGKFTGWFTYAYSRSFIKTSGKTPDETINEGKWYRSNFDKPNQINVIGRLQINPTNSFSFTFTYSTGRPISVPIASYRLGNAVLADFSIRNQYRIPDYHRLDLAYTVDNRQTRLKGLRGSFTFSLYNVYARANPFSIFFKRNDNGRLSAYQLAVVGTVIPALSYNFTF
jgi:hypothetical protein